MKSNHDFSDAKVGDLVTSLRHGYGVIIEVDTDEPEDELCIRVICGRMTWWFTELGRFQVDDFAPTLFKGHIDINSLQVTYNTLPL